MATLVCPEVYAGLQEGKEHSAHPALECEWKGARWAWWRISVVHHLLAWELKEGGFKGTLGCILSWRPAWAAERGILFQQNKERGTGEVMPGGGDRLRYKAVCCV